MRISRTQIVSLIASAIAVSIYLTYTVGGTGPMACPGEAESRHREGSYVLKDTWDKLPTIKVWAKIGTGGASGIDAVLVTPSGDSEGIFGWHEGGSVCIQFRDGQLWARPLETPANPPEEWQGPFIFIGKNVKLEEAYFDRIFQRLCYDSDKSEKWCFGSNSIQIGDKNFRASLFPDHSEMPSYGTPVSIDGQDGFLMFIPFNDGWKVFKDSFASKEGHVDIDPYKSPPWKILSPRKPGASTS